MAKRSKLQLLKQIAQHIDWEFFLVRVWALIVILIACIPPLYDWHEFCLLFGVPILIISIVWTAWQATKAGTEIANDTEEHEKREGL
jgi:hypothetical protein